MNFPQELALFRASTRLTDGNVVMSRGVPLIGHEKPRQF